MMRMCSKIYSIIFLLMLLFLFGCSPDEQYVKDLQSRNYLTRTNAVVYLGEERVVEAGPALMKMLTGAETEFPELRLRIIESLGDISVVESVGLLLEQLESSDTVLQITVIEALGKIANQKAVPALTALLETSSRQDIKIITLWALGQIGGEQAISALTGSLAAKDRYVRFNAVRALQYIEKGS